MNVSHGMNQNCVMADDFYNFFVEPSVFCIEERKKEMRSENLYQLRQELKLYSLLLMVAGMMGVLSHYLLLALNQVLQIRTSYPQLLFFLPILGVVTAFCYQNYGKGAQGGNNLIIKSTQEETFVPLRMGIFTFVFTILTHLFGGSAGREGSAVQIGGVLSNQLGAFFKMDKERKKALVHAGISAGFSSIFGTPLAGAFFGMEMVYVGGLERAALFPCFIASYFAQFIAVKLGTSHELHQIVSMPEANVSNFLIVVFSSVIFGLFGYFFSWSIQKLKQFYQRRMANYLLRGFIASIIFVVLVLIFNGQKYEGLSLVMIDEAFKGQSTILDPILKLGFTSLTLGAGFQGGEVTPLFDIGASLGSSIAGIVHLEPSFLAALGMIAVFGCAANVPITTVMLGIDLFGLQALPYYVLVSFISYSVTGHHGIYSSQKIVRGKNFLLKSHEGFKLSEVNNKVRKKKG